jgi:hypothetical protein
VTLHLLRDQHPRNLVRYDRWKRLSPVAYPVAIFPLACLLALATRLCFNDCSGTSETTTERNL